MHQSIDYDIAGAIGLAANPEAAQFTSLCTIQSPNNVLGPSGQPDLTQYTDVTGMVAIPCKSAPVSNIRIQATEVKALAEIMSAQLRHILLAGYFPDIANHTEWRAVVDGVAWDILGAESDSTYQMTRLEVKLAKL